MSQVLLNEILYKIRNVDVPLEDEKHIYLQTIAQRSIPFTTSLNHVVRPEQYIGMG